MLPIVNRLVGLEDCVKPLGIATGLEESNRRSSSTSTRARRAEVNEPLEVVFNSCGKMILFARQRRGMERCIDGSQNPGYANAKKNFAIMVLGWGDCKEIVF